MKIGILHDDKKIEKIAQEVAENQFTGLGGLTGSIYEEFGIAIAKTYANSLFEVNFRSVGLFIKLGEIQSNNELKGLYLFNEYLKAVLVGLGGFEKVAEFVGFLKETIDEHFLKNGDEKTSEIKKQISDAIQNNRDKIDSHLAEAPNQLNNMIDNFIIQS